MQPGITTIAATAPIRIPSQQISVLRDSHSQWFAARDLTKPLYCLQRPAIRVLQRPSGGGQPPLLEAAGAAAESAFTSLCETSHAIGFWNGSFVSYPYLAPLAQPSMAEVAEMAEMAKLGWTKAQVRHVSDGLDDSGDVTARLKGYAGWLVTDPTFLAERDNLAALWQGLDAEDLPGFPLRRSVVLTTRQPDSHRASNSLVEFQQNVDRFLDHWGLVNMATWDLPSPQGPLVPCPVAADAPAVPRHGVHIVLPVHYHLLGSDQLQQQIMAQQIALATAEGLDTSIAGLPHFEVLGQMLEVQHLETVIRSRYQSRGKSNGFVEAMETAIAAALDIKVSHTQRLRKGISACRRGKRATVSWLRA